MAAGWPHAVAAPRGWEACGGVPRRQAAWHRRPRRRRKLPTLFERCGLRNISNQTTASVVRGATPWARWWQQNLDVICGWGLASGSTETPGDEHQALTALCSDPSVWFITEFLHACSGQRPG